MAKPILLDSVEFAMIETLAKKNYLKPEQYLKKLVKEQYDKLKR
jgi:hypothetical protein